MLNKAQKRTMHCFNSATNVLATAVRSQPSRLDLGNGQGGNWQVFGGKVASGLSLDGNLTLGLPLAWGHQGFVGDDEDGPKHDSNWSPEFICPPACACAMCGRARPCWSA